MVRLRCQREIQRPGLFCSRLALRSPLRSSVAASLCEALGETTPNLNASHSEAATEDDEAVYSFNMRTALRRCLAHFALIALTLPLDARGESVKIEGLTFQIPDGWKSVTPASAMRKA